MILETVYDALTEKGYDPVSQIVGYIMSGDPTYITSHKNARNLIMRVGRTGGGAALPVYQGKELEVRDGRKERLSPFLQGGSFALRPAYLLADTLPLGLRTQRYIRLQRTQPKYRRLADSLQQTHRSCREPQA